jgi:hypothetical protein
MGVVERVGGHPGVEGDPELGLEAPLGDGLFLGIVQSRPRSETNPPQASTQESSAQEVLVASD